MAADKRDVIIEVRGLKNQFGKQVVHENLDLDVYRGEVIGIVGGSGTGKSVLLRSIVGLNTPAAGDVTVFGQRIGDLSADDRQLLEQRWGVLFQQGALFSGLTVAQNIQVPMREHLRLPEALMDEIAAVKIGLVGLGPEAGPKFPSELSGGMIKRAGLARALALDPDVLLMDEAFSALDPLIRRDMQQELVALQKRLKKTIVFVSHDLDEAIALGGRIVLMKDGRVVQQGTAADFLANPADDYVRRFVEHIDVLGVVTAGDAMRRPAAVRPWQSTAAEALAVLTQSGEPVVTVVCEQGRFQGTVDADTLKRAGTTELRLLLSDRDAFVPRSATLNEAVARLASGRGEIAVTGPDGELFGVIANADLVAALARRRVETAH